MEFFSTLGAVARAEIARRDWQFRGGAYRSTLVVRDLMDDWQPRGLATASDVYEARRNVQSERRSYAAAAARYAVATGQHPAGEPDGFESLVHPWQR